MGLGLLVAILPQSRVWEQSKHTGEFAQRWQDWILVTSFESLDQDIFKAKIFLYVFMSLGNKFPFLLKGKEFVFTSWNSEFWLLLLHTWWIPSTPELKPCQCLASGVTNAESFLWSWLSSVRQSHLGLSWWSGHSLLLATQNLFTAPFLFKGILLPDPWLL